MWIKYKKIAYINTRVKKKNTLKEAKDGDREGPGVSRGPGQAVLTWALRSQTCWSHRPQGHEIKINLWLRKGCLQPPEWQSQESVQVAPSPGTLCARLLLTLLPKMSSDRETFPSAPSNWECPLATQPTLARLLYNSDHAS